MRLLETIASNMGTALENARLFAETQRLLKETEQRNAELAIINSVQDALAAKLDMQGIYDSVGDKIREIFKADTTFIAFHDVENNRITAPYYIDRGVRPAITNRPYGKGLNEVIIESGRPLLLNTYEETAKTGAFNIASPDSDKDMNESFLGVPIFRNGKAIGAAAVQSYKQFAYDQNDLRLLATLTNSMGEALENARLFAETQRLLKETEERNAELAIINSVQAALAAELNIQGIYDAVGDKIREIFHQADVSIRIFEPQTNLEYFPYMYENGKRVSVNPEPIGDKGFGPHVFHTRETLVINENMMQEMEKYGSYVLPGTQAEKSAVYVPLIIGEQVRGLIALGDYEREHAFSESDVRLLQTLANSMSVALENARLFNETQRLLKVTEDRAAELAILNDVGEAMTSALDVKTLTYNVGDKLREIFSVEIVDILMYDSKSNMVSLTYSYFERYFENEPPWELGGGLTSKIILSRRPLLLNTAQEINQAGAEAYVTAPDETEDIKVLPGCAHHDR